MCGILGFAGHNFFPQSTLRIMRHLFRNTSVRGTDASGYAYLDSRNQIQFEKAPVPAKTFVRNSLFEDAILSGTRLFIGHCRYATSGPAENNLNNHPHLSRNRRLAIVHNGHIWAHEAITDVLGKKAKTECDSEVIAHLFSFGLNVSPLKTEQKQSILDSAIELDDAYGSFAVAALDRERRGIWLIRNDNPTWILRLPSLGLVLFASQPDHLYNSVRDAMGKKWMRRHKITLASPEYTERGRVYLLRYDGLLLCGPKDEKMDGSHLKSLYHKPSSPSYPGWYTSKPKVVSVLDFTDGKGERKRRVTYEDGTFSIYDIAEEDFTLPYGYRDIEKAKQPHHPLIHNTETGDWDFFVD